MCFNDGASPVPPSFGKTLVEHSVLPRVSGIAPSSADSPSASRSSVVAHLGLTGGGRMRPTGWEHARAGRCQSAFVCGAIASSSARGLQEQTSSSHHGYEDVLQMARSRLPPCFMQEPQKRSCNHGGAAAASPLLPPACCGTQRRLCGCPALPRGSAARPEPRRVFRPYGEAVREPKRQPLRLPREESGRVQSRNATSSLD